ncbi:unnamed protein product, partial [Ectocarpus sp. 13 AM-2016]
FVFQNLSSAKVHDYSTLKGLLWRTAVDIIEGHQGLPYLETKRQAPPHRGQRTPTTPACTKKADANHEQYCIDQVRPHGIPTAIAGNDTSAHAISLYLTGNQAHDCVRHVLLVSQTILRCVRIRSPWFFGTTAPITKPHGIVTPAGTTFSITQRFDPAVRMQTTTHFQPPMNVHL